MTSNVSTAPVHPKGTKATILLTSVFGPYERDDKYGSRKLNAMENLHRQVTREQGPFSPRSHYRTFAFELICANIKAPCTILDFPSLKRFIKEIKKHEYDIIGISSIIMNIQKVTLMCELIRKYSPGSKIVVGGPITFYQHLSNVIDADFIVKGDGVCWFRRYLGQDVNEKLHHPVWYITNANRVFGLPSPFKPAANLFVTLGCPKGCDFCFTSVEFGGKGKSFKIFDSPEEIFMMMCKIEKRLHNSAFTIFDENFLLDKRTVLRLLELFEKYHKFWTLDCFASFDAASSYSIRPAWYDLE